MEKCYEIKNGEEVVKVEVIEINGRLYYAINADFFENEVVAENNQYYWNDELEKFIKEIIDNTTTIF